MINAVAGAKLGIANCGVAPEENFGTGQAHATDGFGEFTVKAIGDGDFAITGGKNDGTLGRVGLIE